MRSLFEKIWEIVLSLALIFLFTWIIFGVYFELPMYNVCYWYMLMITGFYIYGWLKG